VLPLLFDNFPRQNRKKTALEWPEEISIMREIVALKRKAKRGHSNHLTESTYYKFWNSKEHWNDTLSKRKERCIRLSWTNRKLGGFKRSTL
jgi:hypothetical protein